MALYSNCVLYCDGILLANNTTIDTELVSDDQEVMTIPLGWAGLSPSPDKRTVSATNVSPIAGEDYDFEGAKINRTNVELKIQQVGSGKSCVTKGYITSVKRSAGVGQTANISFDFVGTPALFE
jgi:hypothetical protein